jgi:hypothetical protein
MSDLSKEEVEKLNNLTKQVEAMEAQRKAEADAPGELFLVTLRSGDFSGDMHIKALDWKDATRKARARIENENDELDDVDWYPEVLMDLDINEVRSVRNYKDFHFMPEHTLRKEEEKDKE